MPTASERYRNHPVWQTLGLKRDALEAARFANARMEELRVDILGWLTEADKTRLTRQPGLYLSVLDELSSSLNALPATENEFTRFVSSTQQSQLLVALRQLPLPAPKDLKAGYVDLLDAEIAFRTDRLNQLESRILATEEALTDRETKLSQLATTADEIKASIEAARESIKEVSNGVRAEISSEWTEAQKEWAAERAKFDEENNAEILTHAATLAATARAGEALAEYAAGTLSASDWSARAKRERKAAQWMRFGAAAAFIFAGAVGWFIVNEAIRNNFDLTVGDGILRASVAVVIGAFGALLLRESGRHFREADTGEDVALSLRALAPFYAGSKDEIRLSARREVGDAVFVKNVLSRFANRDAAKHATDIDTTGLPSLVEDATKALGKAPQTEKP